jgi:hypothetical protein
MSNSLHDSLHGSVTKSTKFSAGCSTTADINDSVLPSESHGDCCLSIGAPNHIFPPTATENADLVLIDQDWQNFLAAYEEVQVEQEKPIHVESLTQQAIKNGNKVIILQNCTNITFN